MVTASRSKNLRGPRHAAGPLPPSIVKRTEQLEKTVATLREELRTEKVGIIADLKVAMGTLAASQRDRAVREMAESTKLSDETLSAVRDELLQILQRLANMPPPEKSEPARSEPAYVA